MTTTLDTSKAEAFAERLLNILNNGAISIAMSSGHRTKLFGIMASLPPATGYVAKKCIKI